MRLATWAKLALMALPLAAGCGDFWQAPTTSTTASSSCTTNCSTATSGDFYILNAPTGAAAQIYGYSIVSSALNSISGSPWSMNGSPYAMAMASSGDYLYVSGTAGIYAYPVSNGALGTATQVDSADLTALAIQVDGSWLVEAIEGNSQVTFTAVPLNASTGASAGSAETASFAVTQNNPAVQDGKMAVSPDGKTVFAALGTGGTVAFAFNANASAGTSPFGSSGVVIPVANTNASALSVAVDPAQELLYIGESNVTAVGGSGAILAYVYSTIGNATPTQAGGSPIASGGLAPNDILPVGNTSYLYVANGEGTSAAGNISSFSIATSGTSYSIALGSSIAAGTQPDDLAIDSSGTYLLAVSSLGSPYFSSYTFDTTTLTTQVTSTAIAAPVSIVAAP